MVADGAAPRRRPEREVAAAAERSVAVDGAAAAPLSGTPLTP
ncbi:hypothetical protein [Streptomonospora mangrovi]|nr:hypothetical protein [Streptomonospora mangrovi]